MGYEIYIHRKPNYWDEQDFGAITLEDLREIHARHPELEFMDGADASPRLVTNPETGEEIRLAAAGFRWIEGFWLSEDGMLRAKYRDDQTIIDALRLAVLLDARVQGDDGEFYDSLADLSVGEEPQQPEARARSFWLSPPKSEGFRVVWFGLIIALWTPPLIACALIFMLLHQAPDGENLSNDLMLKVLTVSALLALYIAAMFILKFGDKVLVSVWRYISGEDIENP
ncbi:hypothetical protein [Ponticaulis sp.]|uniref:hypothetical protein n=1 Tax=Ponticaulis sp. TaxID=2020902 RepID=UPI000B6D29B5|nr:hypothetical protein [Ponticaulis sp.]MAJ09080.1 hypothetical protein [Ponticaulis sp.]RPG16869.1 MAG: hypothetical protein CBC85_008110 [Hyphomonadaceae bacterium TMED125]HBH90732.1 hypothetical protein [Hyphomonadaceae bacterium]HBJ91625.1 hypothetical protein [Hyphomonadaceae bacterium]|tara:strand:- start:10380 stop:11060 length:681 start_codon:yes stop_codon:yes gene_type:complete